MVTSGSDVNHDSRRGGYTSKDMVGIASEYGDLSALLIKKWVGLGLLDVASRRGLGRGKGVIATWPPDQLHLLIDLVVARDAGMNKVEDLANFPVLAWLLGAEGVPLRQVRRALMTWGKVAAQPSKNRLTQSANRVALMLSWDDTRDADRRKFAQTLAAWALNPESVDEARLAQQFGYVFDPKNTARGATAGGSPVTDQLVVAALRRQMDAVLALERLDEVEDSTFEKARSQYVNAHLHYMRDQPQLAAAPDVGGLYEPLTLGTVLPRACQDLMNALVVVLEQEQGDDGDR